MPKKTLSVPCLEKAICKESILSTVYPISAELLACVVYFPVVKPTYFIRHHMY